MVSRCRAKRVSGSASTGIRWLVSSTVDTVAGIERRAPPARQVRLLLEQLYLVQHLANI